MERCNTDPGAAGGMSMLSQQMKVAYMNQQGTLFVPNDERERERGSFVLLFCCGNFFHNTAIHVIQCYHISNESDTFIKEYFLCP